MNSYGVLIISCSDTDPHELSKQIIGSDEPLKPETIHGSVSAYPWHIETKYYNADVHLYISASQELVSEEFAESVQGVIIHFDNKDEKSFERAHAWQPIIQHYSPEVQLLVCDTCEENVGIPKTRIQEWCIQNGYELVELYPQELSDDEDDFKETRGLKRIVQALHAHMWPNLMMKEKPNYQPSSRLQALISAMEDRTDGEIEKLTSDFGNVLANDQGATALTEEDLQESSAKIDALLEEDKDIFESLANDDSEEQSFESLFEKFKVMKDKAAGLKGEERYMYAEKVAVSFWRALGGDEEEVAPDSNED